MSVETMEIRLRRRSWWGRLMRAPDIYRRLRAAGSPRRLALRLALNLLRKIP